MLSLDAEPSASRHFSAAAADRGAEETQGHEDGSADDAEEEDSSEEDRKFSIAV